MKAHDPAAIPDYAAFCPRYWKGCFDCPEFDRDAMRFCRKYNAAYPVIIEIAHEERKAWWADRKKNKTR